MLVPCSLLAAVGVAGYLAHRFMQRAIRNMNCNFIFSVHHSLELYRDKHGRFPTEAQGIQVLVDEHLFEVFPQDPWDRPYRYRLDGEVPVVSSLGNDKKPGGTGLAADVEMRFDQRNANACATPPRRR